MRRARASCSTLDRARSIANPLFAAYSKITTFIFVDPWEGVGDSALSDIQATLKKQFPVDVGIVDEDTLAGVTAGLSIAYTKTASNVLGFTFVFDNKVRRLIFVKSAVEEFLARNPSFQCDLFFVKDFAATEDDMPFTMTLPCLKTNGMYVSNALTERHIPSLPLFGLTFLHMYKRGGVQRDDCLCEILSHAARCLERTPPAYLRWPSRPSQSFIADNNSKFDYDTEYADLKPEEVEILAKAMGQALIILRNTRLAGLVLFRICRSIVQKNMTVAAWRFDCPAYERAWVRLQFEKLRSLP